MHATTNSPMTVTRTTLLLLCFTALIAVAQGLKGCSSFGHSCFGAHGKRGDPSEDGTYPLQYSDTGTARQNVAAEAEDFLLPGNHVPRRQMDVDSRELGDFIKKWMAALRAREQVSAP